MLPGFMPNKCPVMYQAFRKITNFIRGNGDDWDEFCTSTNIARAVKKAATKTQTSKQQTKQQIAEMNSCLAPKPLLQINSNRVVLFPIQHDNIWKMYKQAEASFWTAKEIDLTSDMPDWDNLSPNERRFPHPCVLRRIRWHSHREPQRELCDRGHIARGLVLLCFQIAVENIHSETYSLLIDTYVKDQKEKMHLLCAIETVPCIKKKDRSTTDFFGLLLVPLNF